MLQAGFPNQPGFIDLLGKLHPSGCIGEPESLAEIAVFVNNAIEVYKRLCFEL